MKAISRISVLLFVLVGPLSLASAPKDVSQASIPNSKPEPSTIERDDGAYFAIVDVYVTNRDYPAPVPPDLTYTGLTFWTTNGKPTCTVPWKADEIGYPVIPSDINYGIGGHWVYIYVKYDWVLATDSTPVLTGIAAAHWPYWNVSCPEGYVAAHGDIGGALTTQSDDACYRIGLCVQYKPMDETDTFITDLSLSRTDEPEAWMPSLCHGNADYWPMAQDEMDIHFGCGDGYWYYIVYNQARKWPPLPGNPPIPSDQEKASILSRYAPLVWQAVGETYYPSSVPWAFDHLNRVWYESAWWLSTIESLPSPSSVLGYFHGCDGSSTNEPCQLGDAPVYAFWDEYDIPVDTGAGVENIKVVDLDYFFYYPYNRGKELISTIWGNHVSDWEHVTVRMVPYWDGAEWSYKPAQIYLSAHDFGRNYLWDVVPKDLGDAIFLPLITRSGSMTASGPSQANLATSGFDAVYTHPIVYQAWGAHGLWKDAGEHVYQHTPVGNLVDSTSAGTPWKTWRHVEAFNYDNSSGLAGNAWPLWMDPDYNNPALGGNNPASGPIFRWGNDEMGTCMFGECQLNPGPTGPVSKPVWDNEWLE
jgi:hypothetical protein